MSSSLSSAEGNGGSGNDEDVCRALVAADQEPPLEAIDIKIKDIQRKVDALLFGSVFLRLPEGLADNKKPKSVPEDALSLEDTLKSIDETLKKCNDLEYSLKDRLDNKNAYEDQLEEYLRDLEESAKALKMLKPILRPENLRDGEHGKTDVSWLSWRRNTLGVKLHKELNELQEIDTDSGDTSQLKTHLKTLRTLIHTANGLLQSAQYLSWFTRRVVEYNESLPEFERDFTVNLVSQWVQEEANKVLEHHKNCVNLQSEIERKVELQTSNSNI